MLVPFLYQVIFLSLIMAHFKIYTWLIILIIASHETLVIEGRQLKPMKTLVYNSKVDQQPSRNAEEKVTFPPQMAGQSQGYAKTNSDSINDLRPTSPGNSPGAGHHSYTENRYDTQGSSPSTGPGHSPGGGHSKENQVVKPNA